MGSKFKSKIPMAIRLSGSNPLAIKKSQSKLDSKQGFPSFTHKVLLRRKYCRRFVGVCRLGGGCGEGIRCVEAMSHFEALSRPTMGD